MTHAQDTSAAADGASAHPQQSARPVFLVGESGSFPPAALAAEAIFQTWCATPAPAPPALVVAPPAAGPALVDHLLLRVRRAEPVRVRSVPALQELTVAAIDQGATLIAGGLPAGDSHWQPSLFVHVPWTCSLCAATAASGPLLVVVATEADCPLAEQLRHLRGPVQLHTLRPDGRIDSSPEDRNP